MAIIPTAHAGFILRSLPIAEFAAVGSVVVLALLLSPVRQIVFAPTKRDSDPLANSRPMRRTAVVAAYLLIFFILGGSLFDMVRDTEHWPWSNFPMYSQIEEKGPSFEDYRLYGVPKSAPQSEFSLATDGRYTQPFDQSRLAEALTLLIDDPKLHQGLQDCLRRYENGRKSGAHDGPELASLRLYRVKYTLDPDALNAEKPDEKILIDEAAVSPTGIRP